MRKVAAFVLSGIREMVESLNVQNGGMISIPVYLGPTLLDELWTINSTLNGF